MSQFAANPIESPFKPETIDEISEGISRSEVESLYEFDTNEVRYIDEILERYDASELSNPETKLDKMRLIDSYIGRIRPGLKSKANISFLGNADKTWKPFLELMEPQYYEAPLDNIQCEEIADAMNATKELDFEVWSSLGMDEKLGVLNKLEQRIAYIQHRPAEVIQMAELAPRVLGNHNHQSKVITLNQSIMERSAVDPEIFDVVLETLIHEGRHAYQHYNVDDRMVHTSAAEVDSWRENYNEMGYLKAEPILVPVPIIGKLGFAYTNEDLKILGERLYYYQPVEIDARNFASDAMSAFHKKFDVSSSHQ